MESVEIQNMTHFKNKIPSNKYIPKAVVDLKNFTHELYSNYSSDFLDPKFSHKLSNTLANDLQHLNQSTLHTIQNYMISNNRNMNTTYQAPHKYALLECEVGLCDLDKNIIKRGGANTHIRYIKDRINERLNNIKQKWSDVSIEEYQVVNELNNDALKNIIQQIVVRGNLIGAIESILPNKNEGDSFIQQRLEGLLNGSLCLPSLKNQKTDKKAEAAIHYLRARSTTQCESLGGISVNIVPPTSGKYWNLSRILVESYESGIMRLREIVLILKNLSPLSDNELSNLADETRKILDDLYIETELYYLLSVLALLEK